MIIGILSDSHGDLELAEEAVSRMGGVDLLLHAGDYYHDALYLGERCGLPVRGVVGNCDRGVNGPQEELLELEGWRIYLTHGHLYGVKGGLLRLHFRARELGARIAVFGHTHVAQQEQVDGITLLNPGSIARSRLGDRGSFAMLELNESSFEIKIRQL